MTPDEIGATWAAVRAASEAWALALTIQGDPARQTAALEAVARRMEQLRAQLPQNFLARPTLAPEMLSLVLVSKSLSEAVQDHMLLLTDSLASGDREP